MTCVSGHIPFHELSTLCEKISFKKTKDKKRVLSNFITKWRDFHQSLQKSYPNISDSFYPAMRLLLPQCERERVAYGIKEHTLARLYIDILCLSKESQDAQKLLNYRAPKAAKDDAGDFANVAYFVLKNRCPDKGTLTIQNVNDHLDSIATNNASKNKGEMKKSLQYLLRNSSPLEQKWLIRMILKDMKMGISENSIFNTFHPDAKDLYNVTNSLEKVCTLLKNPCVRLHEVEISLFCPFRPMLAEQASPEKVERLMQNQSFIIETKYDGERVQLHKEGNIFKYFSRNGNEYTHSYGATPLEGSFTQYITHCFKKEVTSCILDGEMVVHNNEMDCIITKANNIDVKTLQPGSNDQPSFIAFDILMFNGKILSDLPLKERNVYLEKTFNPLHGRLLYAEKKVADSNQEVVSSLNEAIDKREEGIVIKKLDSVYKPNIRRNSGWLKIKPEYVKNLIDDLDLLIIGGYFGEGRRQGLISHFLLGVAVAPDIQGVHPKTFYPFVRVGSGYSMTELYNLLTKLSDHWQVYDKKNPPPNIEIGSGSKERPELWIDPSKSYIVQVHAAEITQSDRFKTGCTLRFPRVEKVRYDKMWYDCLTVTELEDLRKHADGKLASAHVAFDKNEVEDPSPKKRKVNSHLEHPYTVAPQFRPADTSEVEQVSKLFENKEFCVVTGPLSHPKQMLEKLIVEFGGTVVQNPGTSTFCVVADKQSLRVKNIIGTDIYDVVKADWVIKCARTKAYEPWKPSDMWHVSPETKVKLSEEYDKFGDSFTLDQSEENLKYIFNNFTDKDWKDHEMTAEQIAEMECTYFPNTSSLGLFRLCRAYIDNKQRIGDPNSQITGYSLELTALQLRLYGASLSTYLDENTTHVVIHSKECKHLSELKKLANQMKRFHIVTEKWVEECIKENRWLTERHFMPL